MNLVANPTVATATADIGLAGRAVVAGLRCQQKPDRYRDGCRDKATGDDQDFLEFKRHRHLCVKDSLE